MPLDPLTMDWLTRNDLFATAIRYLEQGELDEADGLLPNSWSGRRTTRRDRCVRRRCLPGRLSHLGSPPRLVSPHHNSSSCHSSTRCLTRPDPEYWRGSGVRVSLLGR